MPAVPVNETYDLIIVGGGPAGLTAGIYAMRAVLKTLLAEAGTCGGQVAISKHVENYPGMMDIIGFDLADKFVEHGRSYGLEIIQKRVAAIEPGLNFHSVRFEEGATANAYAVMVATGGTTGKLNIPGEQEYFGTGVSYCATCDGFFFRGKDVVVVGGGDTAVEEALYLAKIARRVYIVHRRDSFRASKILQKRAVSEGKISILFNSIVTEIQGGGGVVSGVLLQDTQTGEQRVLAADGVFALIGLHPNNGLVPQGVEMTSAGYVVTDEKCETSIPGIFAVGDVRQKYARQIVLAAADGCTAALAAARYVEMKKSSLLQTTQEE